MMTGTTPTLPNAQSVRTYTADYAGSDTESEGEAQFPLDTVDEDQQSIPVRFQQNVQFMNQEMAGQTTWILETQNWTAANDVNVVLIRKPTASYLSHRLLNPYIYRNIRNVGSLNHLAALLQTPEDWELRYNQVVENGAIIQLLYSFRALPDDTPEAVIQSRFTVIVGCIALSLGLTFASYSETKIIVGGILARYEFDVRSKADPHFSNDNGTNLLASEVKTHRTFAIGEMWYHGSRGIQLLTALYAFNCPTFLLTQRQWKLFVENHERNAIFTFPYNDNPDHTPQVNPSQVHPMGTTFLKAIAICLLSRRVSVEETQSSTTFTTVDSIQETLAMSQIKPKNTELKPRRQSARLLGKRRPSYISGYDDEGQPIYTYVRLVPHEIVNEIEDEIADRKSSYIKLASPVVSASY